MQLFTIRLPSGETRAARRDGENFIVMLDAVDAIDAIVSNRLHDSPGERLSFKDAHFAPVVPAPEKIICLGLNYETHIQEMNRERPVYPTLFAKFSSALIGPFDDICGCGLSQQLDWEVELACIIGKGVRDASAQEAKRAIAGFTVINDISARDLQWRTTQWLQGKTLEASTPLGPALVTPEDVRFASDLQVSCFVDGDLKQTARTSDLVFSPVDTVRYISKIVKLNPGDVIATGTPGGVGAGRDPQVFLRPGQVVVSRIEGLGECVNRVAAR